MDSTVLLGFYFALMHAGVSHTPLQLLELADLQWEALIPQYLQHEVSSKSCCFCYASCSLKISARVSCAGVFLHCCNATSLVRGILFWRSIDIKRHTDFCMLKSWKLDMFCAVSGWCCKKEKKENICPTCEQALEFEAIVLHSELCCMLYKSCWSCAPLQL